MRNLAPGPKFSVLVAAAVVITLAVWPIGYAEAEKISAEGQKEKRNAEEGAISLKHQRSPNFAEKPPFYQKWETGTEVGDDDAYSGQSDPSGSSSYEDDGYGYDDDDYDHFNYKRYDNDKSKLNEDMKMSNEENKDTLASDKRANVVVPEVTTIELLSFQAKNMNPMADNVQQPKDDSKIKPFSMKKPPYSGKTEEKESLVEDKLKKKTTSDEQKPDGNSNDKNTGNVKVTENKVSDTKGSTDNKGDKGKVSDPGATGSTSVQNLKESPQIEGGKENSVSVSDGKNEAKMAEKDLKNAEAKFQQEEKSSVKMKAEKDSDTRIDEEAAKDESKEKNLSHFEGNPVRNDYKDEFDNVNDPVLADDEKDSEDNGMNLAGLRDSRNELLYQYPNGFRSGKFIKKETARRAPGSHSGIRNSNWASKALERGSEYRSGVKEPFHLEFPVSDLENSDYRRNYLKSLQRFKNLEESAGILSQGDTPSPYADDAKKYLAPKVIEEEQRKRRSRLRRLKANPVFTSFKKRGREEEEDAYDYGSPPRTRMQYGMYERNILGGGYGQPSGTKNYRRRGSHLLRDTYNGADEFEEEGTRNIKNKRQDDAGFYTEEDETYAEKRKSQGKSAWGGGENQKKKLKEANLYEEPGHYNTPLVLLQRNDNGQQAMKTFVDGRYKNEEGVDSEDLARLLSRDNNYVVLRKVPAKEEALRDNGDSKRDKFQITHLDLTMKAQHPSNLREPDAGKLKEAHEEHSLKGKENRIEDLSDFFKGDSQDDRDFDEKKEMLMSIDNRLSQYQRGEPDKSVLYKPSLSQAYRHMKDLDEPENLSDSEINMIRISDKSVEKDGINRQTPERLLKSFKKDGKEFLVMDRAFGGMAGKGKSQDTMMQNVDPLGLANVVPNVMATANAAPVASIAANGNIAQAAKVYPNGMKMIGVSMMPSNMYQNAMIPSNTFQEIKLPEVQKGTDPGRNYFLYGSENDIASPPKHEIKITQGGFSLPADNVYNPQNYNQQHFNSQNYKASSMKNSHGGKAQPLKETKVDQYAMLQQPYGYGKTRQCLANNYEPMSLPGAAEGFKKVAKKDKSSGGLERFIRDFQDFSQASYPNTYKSKDLPGMTLQELTGHGDRHLQKLNSLLKEIMSNRAEENANSRAVKNLKRGMFQKYKDQKSWPATGRGGEAQVRSGKWTSLIYDDGSSQTGYSDKGNAHGESSIKDRKLEGKDATAMLNKDNLSSKRTKRQSGYDSKDSTKILEQKVKSTPYIVQPQPLFPNSNANGNANTNQQQKSPTKACLQLPPDKLMDLLNFFRSEREEFDIEKNTNECLCRRNAPAEEKPSRRKLLSVSEKESLDEIEQKKAECVRKSFESYLDPLVRKIGEYEMKTEDRSRRSSDRGKREIELDESMPNDFQNFLVTSVGSFGSQKRGVVKKDEAVWDSEGSREESTLGKRDTSGSMKTEKKSVSKEDATNIRIKIVDGNENEELEPRASEGTGESKALEMDSNADPSVHEVYLITNADSKGRKKKKFASIGSDQSPQKQPISNHLPQVETVYNPSPGSNKAQVEKISGDTQLKGKCPQPSTVYNATASMMEDNIIRNNLRTGNINTFTYQHKEEPTPYPLQGPTSPPSSEFEMLNSKSLSRTKPFSNRIYDNGDYYSPSGTANGNAEIIYKDQNPQQYRNGGSGGVSMARPGYQSNPMVRVFKSGAEGSAADRYRKDYADEESAYAEYEDGESFSDEISERQADQDYEEQDSTRQGYRRQDTEEYSKAQEHLDPKMVALWNDYARTHLSPERHKEAMEREFEEAYFRSSGQTRYVGGSLNQPNLGVNLIQNLNPNDFERLDKQKTREKLNKRFAQPPEPVQIGRRFFYTFKSEIPDEEYYSLYQGSSNMKSSSDNEKTSLTENAEKSGVTKLSNRQPEEAKAGAKRNSDDFQLNRVKRSESRTKAMEQSRIDKRLSSGRATENRYHKKNLNLKREGKAKEEEEGRQGSERGKRDSLADFLKADVMRRIEEEKKIRSKVKGLSSDLTKYDIPLIGGSSPGEEITLPDLLVQRLEDEKKKEKNMDRNPYLEDHQQQQQQQPFHFGNLKSGNPPDVFKTFEIKRGRRENDGTRAEEGRHAIFSRAGSSTYQDRVFLKGVKTRKVKKYSNEGFEPLRPDARFSEKSGLYSEASKASDEKERSCSSINRRAGDKRSKLKETSAGGQQKLQKLTHGFSHEAPLLTAASPLNSPKIFDALKDGPPPKEVLSLHKRPAETSLLASADARDRTHLKSSKSSAAAKEPLVSAVLVLTKRENPRERRVETEYPAQTSFHLAERSKASSEEKEERASGVEKRKAEWLQAASGEFSRFRPAGQSPEIVNEGADCRGSECETPAKTVNNKIVQNVKQSCFPFRQLNNDRNGGGTGIGNSGEDILESILARVESNPHFRRVIGPGLKWRGRKCKTDAECLQELACQPQDRGLFVRQVRKILARFVKDIEALASQDFSRNICSKLDSSSNKFLHELLDVPYEGVATCKRRKYLGSLLREPSGSAGRSNIADEDSSLSVASAEAKENRRDLVARLLEEYRSLPDEEKRSVEVLGQYLNHELNTLNKALNTDGALPARSGGQHEGRATPAASGESGETNTEKTGITSDTAQEREKDPTLSPAGVPRARSNPKNPKSVKDNCGTNCPPSSAASMTHVPSPKHFASVSTESSNTGGSDESAGSATSYRTEDKISQKGRKLGGLDKLGYGDAAGLQQSLRSRALWLSNLNLSKRKPVDASQMPEQQPVTVVPFPDEYAEAPPANEEGSDDTYGLDYQEYNVYDVSQAWDAEALKHRERTCSGGSRTLSREHLP